MGQTPRGGIIDGPVNHMASLWSTLVPLVSPNQAIRLVSAPNIRLIDGLWQVFEYIKDCTNAQISLILKDS
jgi:hypothetical protein